MADPDNADDWLIIESYARWAGDTAFDRSDVPTLDMAATPARNKRDGRTVSVPKVVEIWVEKRLGKKKRRSSREEQYRSSISVPEPLQVQPPDLKPKSPFIRGHNVRAVVSMVTSRDFEMRGYPVRLDWVEPMLLRAADARRTFAFAGNLERTDSESEDEINPDVVVPAGSTWIMPGQLLRFVSVDSFGLIFVRGTWTESRPFERIGDVYNAFREVLRLLD